MTIYEYASLSNEKKEMILRSQALFLDLYLDNGNTVYVYFLNGFFIEVTLHKGKLVDNLPFHRGYKIDKKMLHEIEKRNSHFDLQYIKRN